MRRRDGSLLAFASILGVSSVASAEPLSRKEVLERVDRFASFEWSLASSECTACACPPTYKSDYAPGKHQGMAYKWGGYDEVDVFIKKVKSGQGAGSHRQHGVLPCVAGVDCSGLVSIAWGTAKKHSTSTLHEVSDAIGFDDLEPGDALNKAGSHVVLFAGTREDGVPIFYEAAGGPGKVRLHHHASWSYLNGYKPLRYKYIQKGKATCEGTVDKPIVIARFPFEEQRSMFLACSDAFDRYSCKSEADEGGKEYVYKLDVPKKSRLVASVTVPDFVDVDLHVLNAPNQDACIARGDKKVNVELPKGTHYLVADTWTDRADVERSGPYRLKVELFEVAEVAASIEKRDAGAQTRSPPGVTETTEEEDGCGCRSTRSRRASLLGLVGLVLLGLVRRGARR